MTESEQVKAALAALADGEPEHDVATGRHRRDQGRHGHGEGPPDERTATRGQETAFEWGTTARATSDRADASADYRAVIERAVDATEDVEAAAAFVESVGLDRLATAVETAEREVSGLAADGREALATFERFRAVAAGSTEE